MFVSARWRVHRADGLLFDPSGAGAGMSELRTQTRRLAVYTAILVVAGTGLAACTTVAGAPATVPQATVTVELSPGPGPQVPLDPDVADELYLMVADRSAAGEVTAAVPPQAERGFGGFVVSPDDPGLPVLRILPTAVYLDQAGTPGRIDDPSSGFYNRVYEAVRPLLDEATRAALPESNPPIPTLTTPIPPQLGAPAIWTLANSDRLSGATTAITINVTRMECSSGKTGAITRPVVSVGDDAIIMRADAETLPDGSHQTCPENDSVAVELALPEPIGDRPLLDAACLEGPARRTIHCDNGAARWTP